MSLAIGVNVHEWFLSPTVPNNKPYVHAYFRYLSKHCCMQNFFWLVYMYVHSLPASFQAYSPGHVAIWIFETDYIYQDFIWI